MQSYPHYSAEFENDLKSLKRQAVAIVARQVLPKGARIGFLQTYHKGDVDASQKVSFVPEKYTRWRQTIPKFCL